MQSFYDEVSTAEKNWNFVQANIHYQLKQKVSVSLFRLVITLYSAVQKGGGRCLENYTLQPSQKGVVQEIIKIDNLSSTKVTTLGCQVCRRRYSTPL